MARFTSKRLILNEHFLFYSGGDNTQWLAPKFLSLVDRLSALCARGLILSLRQSSRLCLPNAICLQALTREERIEGALPPLIDAEVFSTDILGFEEQVAA